MPGSLGFVELAPWMERRATRAPTPRSGKILLDHGIWTVRTAFARTTPTVMGRVTSYVPRTPGVMGMSPTGDCCPISIPPARRRASGPIPMARRSGASLRSPPGGQARPRVRRRSCPAHRRRRACSGGRDGGSPSCRALIDEAVPALSCAVRDVSLRRPATPRLETQAADTSARMRSKSRRLAAFVLRRTVRTCVRTVPRETRRVRATSSAVTPPTSDAATDASARVSP